MTAKYRGHVNHIPVYEVEKLGDPVPDPIAMLNDMMSEPNPFLTELFYGDGETREFTGLAVRYPVYLHPDAPTRGQRCRRWLADKLRDLADWID